MRAEHGWNLRRWFQQMRNLDEWGDGNTLIGAALLFKVRIHVISTKGGYGDFGKLFLAQYGCGA